MTNFRDTKEAELESRLDAVITGKEKLSEAESKALEFETMLFLIRTRGL